VAIQQLFGAYLNREFSVVHKVYLADPFIPFGVIRVSWNWAKPFMDFVGIGV